MSKTKLKIPPPPRKLPVGTLVFIPQYNARETVGIVVKEPTSHFKPSSLETYYIYDVFVTSERLPEHAQIMIVAEGAIGESYEV